MHVASVASKRNVLSSFFLSRQQVPAFEVKTKQSKAKGVGTEPPELMGPAHSAHKLRLVYPNHPKSRYWEGAALVAAKGRINSLTPEGHFPFVCSVLSPWLLWERGFQMGKLVQNHQERTLPRCMALNSGYQDPEGCLLLL